MTRNIEYKNKKYPVKLGYYALKHTKNELQERDSEKKLNLSNLMNEDLEILEPLLYYSMVMGAREEDVELTLKRDEMEFVLDWENNYMTFSKMIPDFFPKMENEEGAKEERRGKAGKPASEKTKK